MRLLEVIQRSAAFLEERGVESPRLQVEWLLASVLRVPRLQLYLQFERTLGDDQLAAIRDAVRRRGRREPLQHILGTAVFCGLELEVSRDALVPRPETEIMAEQGWKWLASRIASADPDPTRSWTALDWGTGTGCLALALAANVPGSEVVAVDRSPAALALARRNGERLGLNGRIRWVESDGCAALEPVRTFDLVVSNPPYIPTGEIETLDPEVKDHDPRLALDGGTDGLEVQRRLAVELAGRMRPGGRLLVEYGDEQGPGVAAVFSSSGWIVDALECDYSGRQRFLRARRPDGIPVDEPRAP